MVVDEADTSSRGTVPTAPLVKAERATSTGGITEAGIRPAQMSSVAVSWAWADQPGGRSSSVTVASVIGVASGSSAGTTPATAVRVRAFSGSASRTLV